VREYDMSSFPLKRLEYVQETVATWWNQWKVTHFSSLVPTTRWKEARRNMRVGDVVLIKYTSKSKAGSYRLGIVKEIEVDEDDLVRTAVVTYSLVRNLSKEERLSYKGFTKKEIRVPIQRLVLILPIEERQEEEEDFIDDKAEETTEEAHIEENDDRLEEINLLTLVSLEGMMTPRPYVTISSYYCGRMSCYTRASSRTVRRNQEMNVFQYEVSELWDRSGRQATPKRYFKKEEGKFVWSS
jgi:hypothetical protein